MAFLITTTITIICHFHIGLMQYGNGSLLMLSTLTCDSTRFVQRADYWVLNLRVNELSYPQYANLPAIHFQVLTTDGEVAPTTILGDRVIEAPGKTTGASAGGIVPIGQWTLVHFKYELLDYFNLKPGTYTLRSYLPLECPTREDDFYFTSCGFNWK